MAASRGALRAVSILWFLLKRVRTGGRRRQFGGVEEAAVDELVIEPGRIESQYWNDLWRYRQLFYFLAWRDLLVRYKQTIIGVAWAVLRPLLTMIVFTVVFGRIAKLPSEGNAPYAILVYAAMLPWQFFASAFTGAGPARKRSRIARRVGSAIARNTSVSARARCIIGNR